MCGVDREPLDESATGEGAPAPAQRAGSEPLGDARGARAGRPSRPSGKQWTAPNNETTWPVDQRHVLYDIAVNK